MYGATWRGGNSDGSRYVVDNSFSHDFDGGTIERRELDDHKKYGGKSFLVLRCGRKRRNRRRSAGPNFKQNLKRRGNRRCSKIPIWKISV